jgi:hypothetical protein
MKKEYQVVFVSFIFLALIGCSSGNHEDTSKLEPSSEASSIALSSQDNTTSSTIKESQNQSSSDATSSEIRSSVPSSDISSNEPSSSQKSSSSQKQSSSSQPSSISSSEAPSQISKSSAPSSSEVPSSSQSSSSSEVPSSNQSSSSKPTSSESSSSPSEHIGIYYHITYKNYDGTILEEKDILEGSEAIYTGETPTREDDEEYTYEFIGWDKENDLKVVSADITATAQFKATGIWGPIIWF